MASFAEVLVGATDMAQAASEVAGNLRTLDSALIGDALGALGTVATTVQWLGEARSLTQVALSAGATGLVSNIAAAGFEAGNLIDALNRGDRDKAIEAALGLGAASAGILAFSNPGWAAANAAFTLAKLAWKNRDNEAFQRFLKDITDNFLRLPSTTADLFNRGLRWTVPRDPLVLDLDGDGVELTNSSSSVLFDHNADGIRAGSQWVMPDDGMLVRDLNGNGLIDSGRELFGDQTQIGTATSPYSGPGSPLLARNGFEALRPLDSNGDAFINSGDAAFAELRVWQDANQDGISQANELKSLSELGISQIKLGQIVETGITVIGGTPQPSYTDQRGESTGQSSFTRNGQEQQVKNINFTSNGFYRDFTDTIAITDAAKALPDMQGSGLVRDLREAMSLKAASGNLTSSAQTLQTQVQAFAQADTAQQRQALLLPLISAWGLTSGLQPALQRPWLNATEIRTVDTPIGSGGLGQASGGGGGGGGVAASNGPVNTRESATQAWMNANPEQAAKLTALEQFNAQPFVESYAKAAPRLRIRSLQSAALEQDCRDAQNATNSITYRTVFIWAVGRKSLASKYATQIYRRNRLSAGSSLNGDSQTILNPSARIWMQYRHIG